MMSTVKSRFHLGLCPVKLKVSDHVRITSAPNTCEVYSVNGLLVRVSAQGVGVGKIITFKAPFSWLPGVKFRC